MAKETKLNQTADIYQPRLKQTEKQKLSEMTTREKLSYFKEYYLMKVIVIIVAFSCLGSLLYSILTPKIETVFYAAVINNNLNAEKVTVFNSQFCRYLGIDPDKENVAIDSSYILNSTDMANVSMQSEQKLSTYIYAQEVDVIIAPAERFADMAYNLYFDDLADQLPTDLYTHLTDSLFSSATVDEKESKSYGIYLTDCEVFDNLGNSIKDPVLGILANSKYKANSIEFIRYLYKID